MKKVLITGGAGFIGGHVAEELLAHGYDVRVVDSLDPQVHEEDAFPAWLDGAVERIEADVRDTDAITRALSGVDAVVHLAAVVGVGQSMYQLRRYVGVNSHGTATLLEALAERPVQRLLVASSMSVYGEGAYRDGRQRLVHPPGRPREQLARREWDIRDEHGELVPIPTPEGIVPVPSSPYALTKYDQELLCLMFGRAYSVPTLALRLFNVYGPRQALSNPYTGVMAIFACRLLNDRPPLIYEDGAQLRDFVHVRDVARAFRLALEQPEVSDRALNIGSGEPVTIEQVARTLNDVLDRDLDPQFEGKYRFGDVRHCFADISAARESLGYAPRVSFEAGITELAAWLAHQTAFDHAGLASAELARRGLTL